MDLAASIRKLNDSTVQDVRSVLVPSFLSIYAWAMYGVLCQIICIFGIVTNIINIICFVKQGFHEQINISLSAMAVSDIGSLLTLCISNICICLPFTNLTLHFDPIEVQYLISGMPHTLFTRITAWITVFITFERCLCLAIPLKVKSLITKRRVTIVIVSIYAFLVVGQSPIYAVNSLGWKYSHGINNTIFGIVYSSNRDTVESVSYIVNNLLLSMCAFVFIIILSISVSIQLRRQAEWRQTSSTDTRLSHQNKMVAKLVVVVSLIYIICFIPTLIVFIMMAIFPEFLINENNSDYIFIGGGVGIVLESINSAVNIFVYYRMSTKYRGTFNKIFCNTKE